MFCGRCGRPLVNENSIKTGIGPDCRKILEIERILRNLDMVCKNSMSCTSKILQTPELLKEAKNRYEKQGISWDEEAEKEIIELFGFNRERVELSEEQKKMLEEDLEDSNDKELTKREFYRIVGVCPFHLDCKEPWKSSDLIFHLISLAMQKAKEDENVRFYYAVSPLLDILETMGIITEKDRKEYKRMEKKFKSEARKLKRELKRRKLKEDLEKGLEELLSYLS
jgi:hypothetical protein